MTAYSDKSFLGGLSLKKRAGEITNGFALNTQINIPVLSSNPSNPVNFTYPGVLNGAAGPTSGVAGQKTPLIGFGAPMQSSWATAKLFNDLMGGSAGFLDSNFNTSAWDINYYEPVLGNRRFTDFKFMGLDVVFNAAGGAVGINLVGCGIYGDDEGTPATFTPYANVPGQEYGTADVVLSGVDQCDSLILSWLRAQSPQHYANASAYAVAVTSGATGGSVTTQQSRTATMTAPVGMTIGASGTGVKFQWVVNLDNANTPFAPGRSVLTRSNSLVDFTGTAFATYPLSCIVAP